MKTLCHHCNEPVPAHEDRQLTVEGEQRAFCCAGCEAVARLILDAGLDDYYRFRTQPGEKVEAVDTTRWRGFDTAVVLDAYSPAGNDGLRELRLQLDNLRCAACGWLAEQTLAQQPGVCDVRLNTVTGLATVRWRQEEALLSALLATLETLGFKPRPLRADEYVRRDDAERKQFLKRLAVAGLGMMQVMMYGIAMYIGVDMDARIEQFLRYVSLVITTPVVFYAAAPFFRTAWRDVQVRRLGMDVPVSAAIGGAYLASVWHTFAGSGEVYFDSIAMFVFFLLIGRFVEFSTRHQVRESGQALIASLPATADRIDDSGTSSSIPLTLLKAGDKVRVTYGSTVPADGRLLDRQAMLDESLLTGESCGVTRHSGETISAGAINSGTPFLLEVSRVGRDTVLSSINRLLERAQSERPHLAHFADRLARYFVGIVLAAGTVTALAWSQLDPARAFEITLSVLVVACPCALALAVPVALTTATSSLARHGLLTVNSDALESLSGITDIVFDKTGTLTTGKPQLRRTIVTGNLPQTRCLALAAGLEKHANHPIASAFLAATDIIEKFTDVKQQPGLGLEGTANGQRYRIGTSAFALRSPEAASAPAGFDGSWVVLADDNETLAWFELDDTLRDDVQSTLQALREKGFALHLLSGDSASAVGGIAVRLRIGNAYSRQRPEDKLARLRELQSHGHRLLMIGDGINDAPVLAGADVSIAMARGAAMAHSSADMILNGPLSILPGLLDHAGMTRRVIRQNLLWALGYNVLAMPLAALGLVAPWMAAIGMSASSLLVTLNALRLRRLRARMNDVSVAAAEPGLVAGGA